LRAIVAKFLQSVIVLDKPRLAGGGEPAHRIRVEIIRHSNGLQIWRSALSQAQVFGENGLFGGQTGKGRKQ
jgi:hypothetical protein